MNAKKRLSGNQRTVRLITVLSWLLAGVFLASAANAAEAWQSMLTTSASDHTGTLTLQQCIDLALEKNHNRVASRYSIEIAEAQHRQALSAYWPQVGIKANYTIM